MNNKKCLLALLILPLLAVGVSARPTYAKADTKAQENEFTLNKNLNLNTKKAGILDGQEDPDIFFRHRPPQCLYQNAPGTSESKLTPVGKGINATTLGPYAYDSKKVSLDVIDREWLVNQYSKGFYDDSEPYTLYKSVLVNDISEINEKSAFTSNTEAHVEGTYGYYKAKLTESIGFSTSVAKLQNCSSLVFNGKTTKAIFSYTLPEFEKYKTNFLSNLSASFLSKLADRIQYYNYGTGSQAFYELFDTFGTHVLWSASYGGACDVVYSAKAENNVLEGEATTSLQTEIDGSADVSDAANIGGGVGAEFRLSDYLKTSSSSLVENMEGRYYGGEPKGGVSVVSTFKKLIQSSEGWIDSIDVNSCSILSYRVAHPIWDFLPTQYQSYRDAIERAFDDYCEARGVEYYDIFTSMGLGNTVKEQLDVITGDDMWTAGHYNSGVKKQEKSFVLGKDEGVDLDVEQLKKCGYKTVTIQPVFDLRLGKSNKPSGTIAKIDVSFCNDNKHYEVTGLTRDKLKKVNVSNLRFSVGLDKLTSEGKRTYKIVFDTNDRPSGFWWATERTIDIMHFDIIVTFGR